jgi:hypothetical protein
MQKELYTVGEAAQILNVDRDTIYRWRKNSRYLQLFKELQGAEGDRPILRIIKKELDSLLTQQEVDK